MKKIRYGSFETNSSSTHAIVVPKQVNDKKWNLSDSLDHNYGFGRQECRLVDCWDEKLVYSYLILKDTQDFFSSEDYIPEESAGNDYIVTKDDIKRFKDNVNKAFNQIKKNYNYYIKFTPNDIFNYIDSGREDGNITGNDKCMVITEGYGNYVDDIGGFKDDTFILRLLNDYEFLKKFIFNNDSYITICGDEYRGYNIKTIGFEYDYAKYYYVNEKGEEPPKEWYDEDGILKAEYWEDSGKYNIIAGEFWDKLKEYQKDNDVYLK